MLPILNDQYIDQPPVLQNMSNELHVVISGLALGGAEQIVLDWANRVFPKWRVHIIVLRNNKREWPVPSHISISRMDGSMSKLSLIGEKIAISENPVCLCHLLRKHERDVLSKAGVTTVPVLHNAKTGWLENESNLRVSQRVIAVSQACANDLTDNGYNGNVSIIRHLPSPRQFDSNSREKILKSWNIPVNSKVIGMIGAIKPQKAYPFALRVFKEYLKENDAYLVILGGPIGKHGQDALNAIMSQIKLLKLRSRIVLPGFVQNATKYLPAFNIMLNTSSYEGLSIATLEALVNKVPVVASKVGGQGEITSDNLYLIPEVTSEKNWSKVLENAISVNTSLPFWAKFPSYRLWSLNHLAKPLGKSSKVLFVTANLNSGGAQRSLVNLITSLKNIPVEVAVNGKSTTAYFFNSLRKAGVKVFRSTETKECFDHAEILVQYICANNISTICFWNTDPKIKLLLTKTLGFTKIRFIDVSPGKYAFQEMDETKQFQHLIAFNSSDFYRRLNNLVLKFTGESPREGERDICVV